MALENLLPSTVTVQRKTRTPDGRGGHTIEYVDDHEEVVRIDKPSGKDVPIALQKQGVVLFPVYADLNADIHLGDRLTLNGRTYEVRCANLGPPAGPYAKWFAEEYVIGR